MPILDAYAHVSLPRFLSVDDCLQLMDRNDVEAAVLSTAETCPDIQELSRAITAHPDRFRAVGMPLGTDEASIRANIRAQLDSGFSGIRLPATLIAQAPVILEDVGEAGGFAIVVGERGLQAAAGLVADYLDRHPGRFVIAGHFGGPADPALLDQDPAVGRLFAHPSLYVAMTRHGAMAARPVEAWARALVARVGWTRLLWGSEWPVALWRNETYRSTLEWVLRLGPTEAEVHAFRYSNAHRLMFAGGPVTAVPVNPSLNLMPLRREADIWLFPPSLDLSELRHRAIYHAYVAWGGEDRGAYSEFILAMAERGITAQPG